MEIGAWIKLAHDVITKTKVANKNAEKLTKVLIDELHGMSCDISNQWMQTHEIVKRQLIDNDLINNDKLIDQQREVRKL